MSRECFAAGRANKTCDSRRQRHHVVKQQHIKLRHRELTAAHRRGGPKPPWRLHTALKDPRLWRWVCGEHHGLEKTARLEVHERDLPDGFWNAVTEYGLDPWVPSHLINPEAKEG